MSCLLQQFASQSSFWLGTMCHKASGCTQLKMLFHSSAGLRRKACADVSNSGRHYFPDIRKTSLPAWQSAQAGESLRSLLCISSMYCFSWKLKLDAFVSSREQWKSSWGTLQGVLRLSGMSWKALCWQGECPLGWGCLSDSGKMSGIGKYWT